MKVSRRLVGTTFGVVMLLAMVLAPLTVHAAPPVPEAADSAPVAVKAPPVQGTPTTVTAYSGLRLREGPSLADPIILTLRYRETVYPSAGPVWNEGISWTFVGVYRGGLYYEGFCATAYLAQQNYVEPEPETGLKVTAKWGLRLRSGPGKWYSIQRIVPYGTILQSTGYTQWSGGLQWTEIAIDGLLLWAASVYLTPV